MSVLRHGGVGWMSIPFLREVDLLTQVELVLARGVQTAMVLVSRLQATSRQ